MTLLTRLESLTGPSRRISDELLLSWGWTVQRNGPRTRRLWISPDGSYSGQFPHPTASIDDALLGVPEGWRGYFTAQMYESHQDLPAFGAHVFVPVPVGGVLKQSITAEGSTPAIALCIAIVKARGGV